MWCMPRDVLNAVYQHLLCSSHTTQVYFHRIMNNCSHPDMHHTLTVCCRMSNDVQHVFWGLLQESGHSQVGGLSQAMTVLQAYPHDHKHQEQQVMTANVLRRLKSRRYSPAALFRCSLPWLCITQNPKQSCSVSVEQGNAAILYPRL